MDSVESGVEVTVCRRMGSPASAWVVWCEVNKGWVGWMKSMKGPDATGARRFRDEFVESSNEEKNT